MFQAACTLLAFGLPLDAHAQRSIMGPDARACEQGTGPAFLVQVRGFKKSQGDLRVQIYGSDPQAFLAKGKWLRRIDLPVGNVPVMPVCVGLPAPGAYAVAVRHDVDGNGKSGWNDGGGFSRNPSLSLFHLKPAFEKVVVSVGSEVKEVPVVLNYRHGLSIRPIGE
ncbi:DUF2141 domain-containing protein [Sphingobium baderi]|uniref:DUF2141 domain-containing protein n=1 Tax=Sphingobium baderi TaxID=1332080 RepID=UPI002B406583|nr:DUF2141 domain-containing protein [Sphingobium baderi]WRD78786.1 DUF2141 domain-containing protein [Sphingobium baderi]